LDNPSQLDPEINAVNRIPAVQMVLRVLRETTGMRYALVARVTPDSWTACAVIDDLGLGIGAGDHLELSTTYCNVVQGSLEPLMMSNVSEDERYRSHPAHALYGVESYLAVPLLRRDGSYFGTLCALDNVPADLSAKHVVIFELLASLISFELEAEDSQRSAEQELIAEKEAALARERLIGILGHDLRTPLTAVTLGAHELVRNSSDGSQARSTALGILASAKRAARMVRDLLDFTRARLAGGIPIWRNPMDLGVVVEKVLGEIRAGASARTITFQSQGDCTGSWDADRAAQVISNLVSNAVQHGAAGTPISVSLRCDPTSVILDVENTARKLPAEEVADLFSPFRRPAGPATRSHDGLGLGLFIVNEIMRAHGGTVEMIGGDDRIVFRATWPR